MQVVQSFAITSCYGNNCHFGLKPYDINFVTSIVGWQILKMDSYFTGIWFGIHQVQIKEISSFRRVTLRPSLDFHWFNIWTINFGWVSISNIVIWCVVWRYNDLSLDPNFMALYLSLATTTYSLPSQILSDHWRQSLLSWYQYGSTEVPHAWGSWESIEWLPFRCLWWTLIWICNRIENSLCWLLMANYIQRLYYWCQKLSCMPDIWPKN